MDGNNGPIRAAKDCPFCGCKAHHNEGDAATRLEERVSCLSCFAEITGEGALEVWNTRVDPEKAKLFATLKETVEFLKRGDYSTGYCCCGSPTKTHGLGDGHSAVDEGDYHAGLFIKSLEKILEKQCTAVGESGTIIPH